MNDRLRRIRYMYLMIFFVWMLTETGASQSTVPDQQFMRAIEGNSFFVEEAFNQEEQIVQNIFSGLYFKKPDDESYLSFTQEWPIAGVKHQLSYTIPYAFVNSNRVNGLGDIVFHYRYQLFSHEDRIAMAPRFSIIIPTGKPDKNLGFGTVGVQLHLPVSKRLSNYFITHLNAGLTLLPGAKNTVSAEHEVSHTLAWFDLAGSIVWLASENFNVLLEVADNFYSKIGITGDLFRYSEVIFCPALRFAMNMHDLQIVPGVGVPVTLSRGDHRTGIFGYVSFEFPY